MSPSNKACVVFFMVVSLLMDVIFSQDSIDMKCNPSIRHRFDVCPIGYCCVRDEFLPTYVYCRKIGQEDENCTTRDNESECPCGNGLTCKPNIVSSFQSLYGRCYNATKDTTTTPPPPPTTTTTTTHLPTTTTTTMVTSDPIDTTEATTIPAATMQDNSTSTASSIMDTSTKKPALPFKIPVIG